MLHLIGGTNLYKSREFLEELIRKYSKDYEIREFHIDDENDISSIISGGLNMGFFSTKSILVIKSFEKAKAEQRDQIEELAMAGIDLVVWSRGKLDKRTKFYKLLKSKGQVDEFNPLKGASLSKELFHMSSKLDLHISKQLLDYLSFRVGEDEAILINELKKLKALQDEGIEVNQEVIKEIVVHNPNATIWDLIDAVSNKNKSQSFVLLDQISQDVEYEAVMGAICRQIRLLLLACEHPNKENLQKFGIHPFVVSKLLKQIVKVNKERLKKLYAKLVDIEIAVKSGNIEKSVALDLVIIAF